MARILKRFNPAGIFIDRFGHYSTEALIAIASGTNKAALRQQAKAAAAADRKRKTKKNS